MEKGFFKVPMMASQPAGQRSARRNQRCFCFRAGSVDSRPRPGSATFCTPRACASRWFWAEKNPRRSFLQEPYDAGEFLLAVNAAVNLPSDKGKEKRDFNLERPDFCR
jgi:hypothetical protein